MSEYYYPQLGGRDVHRMGNMVLIMVGEEGGPRYCMNGETDLGMVQWSDCVMKIAARGFAKIMGGEFVCRLEECYIAKCIHVPPNPCMPTCKILDHWP